MWNRKIVFATGSSLAKSEPPRAAARSTLLFLWATGCGGVQSLPENKILPSPPGGAAELTCETPASEPAVRVLDFDENWQAEGAAFGQGQPLASAVPAGVVRPRWSKEQRASLPQRAVGEDGVDPHLPTNRELVPLGGDYWQASSYAIVPEGSSWVSSSFASSQAGIAGRGDGPTGSLVRELSSEERYLQLLVGGDDDERVGVELLAPAGVDISGCSVAGAVAKKLQPSAPAFPQVIARWSGRNQDATQAVELDLGGKCQLQRTKLLLRLFDASPAHHINVGSVVLSDVPLAKRRSAVTAPVWGFADFHTHPTSYLAFGGLQGIHTMWGVAGGGIKEYVGNERRWAIARDLPACDVPHKRFNSHHGGFAAPLMLNTAEQQTSTLLGDLGEPAISNAHGSQGAPTFADFPHHQRGAHFKYHITQIHRAYLGGLRLMSALAVHNSGLEYGAGWVTCSKGGSPTVETTTDKRVILAHVKAMQGLAELNKEWLEIAYTPAQARRIIRENKLAVVLGVEVPQLGLDADVRREIEELYAIGIRQTNVVHGMDNDLGGTALFQDLYNTVNDWMHRDPSERDHIDELAGKVTLHPFKAPTYFFQVVTSRSPLDPGGDEPILFRLANPPRIALSDLFPHPSAYTFQADILGRPISYGALHPLIYSTPLLKYEQGPYDRHARGHRNPRGLSGRGREFVQRSMRRGMMIDIAHMSDQTLKDTFSVLDESCRYPALVSHAHFRRLAVKQDYSDRAGEFVKRTEGWVHDDLIHRRYPMGECVRACNQCSQKVTACLHDKACRASAPDPCVRAALRSCNPRVLDEAIKTSEIGPFAGEGTVDRGNLPREYDLPAREVSHVTETGGAIGLFIGQTPIDTRALGVDLPFQNDCAGTSKSFAAALLYGLRPDVVGGRSLGLASDFAMTAAVLPRFGLDACGSYLASGAGSESALQLLETLMEPSQYRADLQRDGVVYTTGVSTCSAGDAASQGVSRIACGRNRPLEPYVMGLRTFDFNVDGMASYAQLPDMLQDTANVLDGQSTRLGELFNSAEAYIRTWERARSLAGLDAEDAEVVKRTDDEETGRSACGAGCPKAWNHGAPLQSVGEFFDNCPVGKAVKIPRVDEAGKPADSRPMYQQHGTDTAKAGDLTQQGDWALFSVGPHPVWTCGDGKLRPMDCPAGTNYVKVRRVLDTTLDRIWEPDCNRLPLPPENGNRAVLFQCLAGPHPDEVAKAGR
ncbi:MAG TPA: membrane dipeptidase [Polyangiaceae bacterium]|nr:membrane dipeptidase [Polyangiaceae bacterium]